MQWTTVRAGAAIVSFLCLATCAQAGFMSGDIIRLGDAPGFPGGLFDVKKPGDPTVLFQTFCAHVREDLDYETNYKAIVSDLTDPDNKPVGPQAAWLFTQFWRKDTEQLPGFLFNLTTPASNSNTYARDQARALQLGIWLGMGFSEPYIRSNTGWSQNTVDDLWDNFLEEWLDNYEASGWGPANYIGHVRILNLYGRDQSGAYTVNVQDQLYIPEPGALALFGCLMACTALSGAARKRGGHEDRPTGASSL